MRIREPKVCRACGKKLSAEERAAYRIPLPENSDAIQVCFDCALRYADDQIESQANDNNNDEGTI